MGKRAYKERSFMKQTQQKYNYMILMRKWELVDFFKYGRFYVRCPRVEFDGNVASLCADTQQAKSLFNAVNPIESGLDAFLLQVNLLKPISDTKPIRLADVVAIYALDDMSLRVGLQLYPPVRLNAPLGGAVKEEYELSRARAVAADVLDGVANVKAIFGLADKRIFEDRKAKLIGGAEALKRYIELGMAGDQPGEGDNVWTYLLRYERHQNYPAKMRGYFLDMLHVLADFKAQQAIDESVLERDGEIFGEENLAARISVLQETNYDDILGICLKSKSCKEILKKDLRIFIPSAPIFLMLEDVFREGMDNRMEYGGMTMQDFIKRVNMTFSGTQRYVEAIYLLGLKLGREGTYLATCQIDGTR